MIITRKSLAEITELCMTLREPILKGYKRYTLHAKPQWSYTFDGNNVPQDQAMVGIVIKWYPLED